jgi:uncharacterized protein (UPF0332 family)
MRSAARASICDAGGWRLSEKGPTSTGRSTRSRCYCSSASGGRAAYLAAHHAAQALIFDRAGKISKTHNGVLSEFARLAKDDSRIDRAFLTFLAQAYNLKAIADYAVGSDADVTFAEAQQAIEIASRFIECISDLIASSKPVSGNESD